MPRQTKQQLLDENAALRRALQPFAYFARQWNRQPLLDIADEFYSIHTGTQYAASLKISMMERARLVLEEGGAK